MCVDRRGGGGEGGLKKCMYYVRTLLSVCTSGEGGGGVKVCTM